MCKNGLDDLFFTRMYFFSRDVWCCNLANTARKIDSSSALESYGPLLSNAPSLASIRALLAKLEHETSTCKTKIFKMKNPKIWAKMSIFRKFPEFQFFENFQIFENFQKKRKISVFFVKFRGFFEILSDFGGSCQRTLSINFAMCTVLRSNLEVI